MRLAFTVASMVLIAACKTSAPAGGEDASAVLAFPSDTTSVEIEPNYLQVQGTVSGMAKIELGSFFRATSSLPGCWSLDLSTITNAKSKVIDIPATINGSEYTVRTYTAKQGICGYAWPAEEAVSLSFETADGFAGYVGFKRGHQANTGVTKITCRRSETQQKVLNCTIGSGQASTHNQMKVDLTQLSAAGTNLNINLTVED